MSTNETPPEATPAAGYFKKCPNCDHVWTTREDMLSDPLLNIIGYMADMKIIEDGLFLFDHATCKTTLAAKIRLFVDLYDGPVFPDILFGKGECEGHCVNIHDLERCSQECNFSRMRELILLLANWPRR
ncbi:hypothetical protein ACFL1X_09810 [Candidatus Hydrogenedentota bacterium]